MDQQDKTIEQNSQESVKASEEKKILETIPEQKPIISQDDESSKADLTILYRFNMDLSLVNVIRSFKHENHQFPKGFIEDIYCHLFFFKGSQEAEIFDQYAEQQSELTMKQIVLQIHYILASIYNLEELIKVVEPNNKEPVIKIDNKMINNTNILNTYAMLDLYKKLDHALLSQKSKLASPNFIKSLTFAIVEKDVKEYDSSNNLIYISYDYISLGIMSKGKLDAYLTSYVANKLNQCCKVNLYHVLFAFAKYLKDGDQTKEYTEHYSRGLVEISEKHKNLKFDKQIYDNYVHKLVKLRDSQSYNQQELDKLLMEIEEIVSAHIISRNLKLNDYIEKLLIGMLGHSIQKVRDKSIVLLNILYDGVDWQKDAPLNPVIKTVGQKIQINYLVESLDGLELCVLIKSFLFIPDCEQNILSYHKPSVKEVGRAGSKRYVSVTLDLGRFTRCGYFDWRLVRTLKDGTIQTVFKIENIFKNQTGKIFHSKSFSQKEFEQMEKEEQQFQGTKPVQGRFIVQPRATLDLQLHEVIIDYQNAKLDQNDNILKRGSFKTVYESLDEYKTRGCNALYLMGALERDNGVVFDKFSNQPNFLRPDASPLAVTSKTTPNTMLGGSTMFKQVTKKAKDLGIMILVDSLTRVSSSRMEKKYRKQMLSTLDSQGKRVQVYGSDGRAVYFEDTSLLNFRKKNTWNLFFDEIIQFVRDYNVQGIHLDNGQSWPQMFKIDENEMYRKESNGDPAYTDKQIFEGEIVDLSEEGGFWKSEMKNTYPNPFIKRTCQKLWQRFPEFLIISEVWGQIGGLEAREYNIIQSGPIPRLFMLPIAICQFFGQTLKKDGTLVPSQRKNVNSFKRWYETYKKNLPKGSIVVQSTTYHTWPYPALLFKKGTWAAVDLFFFLPDLPMTILGEKEGKATKVKGCNFFAAINESGVYKSKNQVISELEVEQEEDNEDNDIQEMGMIKQKTQPIGLLQSSVSGKQLSIQEANSNFFQDEPVSEAPVIGFGYNVQDSAKTIYDADKYGPQGNAINNSNSASSNQISETGNAANTQVSVNSFKSDKKSASFLKLNTEQSQNKVNLINSEGQQFIDALKNIHKHYEHRRALRSKYRALRKGKFVSLLAEHMYGWHTHVLAFSRFTKKDFVVIVINFNDGPVDGEINLKRLADYFPNYQESNVVIQLENVLHPNETDPNNLFYIGEFIDGKIPFHLEFFETQMYSVKIFLNNHEMQQQAQQHSLARLQERLTDKVPQLIYSNDIAERLYLLASKAASLKDFINGFSCLYSNFLREIDLNYMISLMKSFQQDFITKNRLFAFFNMIVEKGQQIPDILQKLPFFSTVQQIVKTNRLKEIVIATPEYSKWTKTGGLGVMTDELSNGLKDLGETVYVITPWYEAKAKEAPDALKKDGINFEYNLDVYLGNEKQTIGVHYGNIKGVHIFFLHNSTLFYSPYEGDDPKYVMRSITLFARGVLEVLCKIQVFPDLIITNDWYSALIPAYIKNKTFGKYFQNTKTFHIVHNLDVNYEGRQYPKPEDHNLESIHELPDIWFVDPYWKQPVVNPSRCAFLTCDNWGTVSHSYKFQLLNESPLAGILSQFKYAFSYPNGLRKEERINILKKTAPSHIDAKAILQKRYFNFKQLDNNIPFFGFVGRLTEQKGVLLILEAFEELMNQGVKQIQVLVGGYANCKEPYGQACAQKLNYLKQKYPYNIWGEPENFFKEGPIVNLGSDFGLMPSKFEPGGIVQHEFFVAETPVIAMKTGGLQDTVFEYNEKTNKGSGFLMQYHSKDQLVMAIQKALKIYKNPVAYQKLRQNAFKSVIDVSEVSRVYAAEFYRMFNKNFLDYSIIESQKKNINSSFNIKEYQPQILVKNKVSKIYSRQTILEERYKKILQLHQDNPASIITFVYRPQKGQLPKTIFLAGNWDNFKHKYPLKYNNLSREWGVTLNLVPGEYFYKFIIDDEWVCNPDSPLDTDIYGNINNIIKV